MATPFYPPRSMNDQDWFNAVAVGLIAAVVVGGTFALLLVPSSAGTPTATRAASTPTVYRNLTVSYQPAEGQFDYTTLDLSVPLHTRVVFTITNFDTTSAALPNASVAKVSGTWDGTMTYTDGGVSAALTQLPPGDVSHTFTLSNAFYHVNVPVPASASGAAPVRVVFSVVFNTPGTFTWGCVVLCGEGAMANAMWGHITVG